MILFTILQADRYIDRNMFLTLSEKIYSFSIKILEQMRIVTTKSATATGNTHTNTYRVNATKLSSKGSFALGDNDDDKKMGCMDTNGTIHTRQRRHDDIKLQCENVIVHWVQYPFQ